LNVPKLMTLGSIFFELPREKILTQIQSTAVDSFLSQDHELWSLTVVKSVK